jgi:hypothetical protein
LTLDTRSKSISNGGMHRNASPRPWTSALNLRMSHIQPIAHGNVGRPDPILLNPGFSCRYSILSPVIARTISGIRLSPSEIVHREGNTIGRAQIILTKLAMCLESAEHLSNILIMAPAMPYWRSTPMHCHHGACACHIPDPLSGSYCVFIERSRR